MNTNLEAACKLLDESTWRRDFWRNAELRRQVHQQQTGYLTEGLRMAVKNLSGHTHATQSVQLDVTSTFAIHVRERESSDPIASCFINIVEVGVFRLQILPRGANEIKIALSLDCSGQGVYFWRFQDQLLHPSQLPDFILQKIIEVAAVVMDRETPDLASPQ